MQRIPPILKDIRFWILLFFLLRLYGITFPPLETGHNWRQSIVNMVARNFFEGSSNIFFPRVDMAGNGPGIAGMEFPLLNYLIYLFASVFGWQDWYGRLIVLITSSMGSWYFYRILKEIFWERLAFYAGIILLVSIWFAFSRKVMPDVFACSLAFIAFYHGLRFLGAAGGPKQLLTYAVLGTLAVLSKIPAGFILLFLLPLFFHSAYAPSKRAWLAGISAIMTGPVLFWYFHWVPYLNETYGGWSFPMSREIERGFQELLENGDRVLKRFYSSATKYIAFFTFLGGIAIASFKKEKRILIPLAIGLPAFFLFMLKAGVQFPKHDYYVIPFVPLMALVAAYSLTQLPYRWMTLTLLLGIGVEGIANRWHTIPLDEDHKDLLKLEEDLDKISDPDALILINSGRQPTPLYFAHRKGWLARNEEVRNEEFLREKMEKGLRYVVVLKQSFSEPVQVPIGKKVLDETAYSVHRLKRPTEEGAVSKVPLCPLGFPWCSWWLKL